jgi:hypothetical protein
MLRGPLLDTVLDSDAAVTGLESYLAIPANVINEEVSFEKLVDRAFARIGAEVEEWRSGLILLSKDELAPLARLTVTKKSSQPPHYASY